MHPGLEQIDTSELEHCQPCKLAKSQRMVSREPRQRPALPLDEIHTDVSGPINPPDVHGHQYIFMFTDARTRYRWVYLATHKSEGYSILQTFLSHTKMVYNKTPRVIFSDGGGEYINNNMTMLAQQLGIQWDVSAPYTPEQNGVAESSNKVIIAKARAMMIDSGLPQSCWNFAVQHSCFITNNIANIRLKAIPAQLLSQELNHSSTPADLTKLRRFGCKAYIHINNMPHSAKFAPRANIGWFFGFQKNTSSNYLIWMPTPRGDWRSDLVVSPHCTFDEGTVFGYAFQQLSPLLFQGENMNPSEENSPQANPPAEPTEHAGNDQGITPERPVETYQPQGDQGEHTEYAPPSQRPDENTQNLQNSQHDYTIHSDQENHFSDQDKQENTPSDDISKEDHPSDDNKTQSFSHKNLDETQFEDQNCEPPQDPVEIPGSSQNAENHEFQGEHSEPTDTQMTPFDPIITTGKRKRIPSPEPTFRTLRSGRQTTRYDYKRLNSQAFANAAQEKKKDPMNFAEAISRPYPENVYWKKAMLSENDGLEKNRVMKFCKRDQMPKGSKALTGRWVYKTKYLPNGEVEKYKARYTARGFTQKIGVDYINTFAPTPRPSTTKVLLALCAQYGWKRTQVDVDQAFLNPAIDKEIYIQPEPEMLKMLGREPDEVIKVLKGLYGLKQAANLWFHDASRTMKQLGLRRTTSDACLFKGKGVLVLMYVDDFQILSPSQERIDKFVEGMKQRYSIKTVDSNLFLGINITSEGKNTIKLSQKHYALEKLKGHDLEHCKPVKRPLEKPLEPYEHQHTREDYEIFNRIIGELQYLSNHTRPDITFATNHLARFLQNPGPEHVTAAKRIWRYIAGTLDFGPTYTKRECLQVEAYSDSDFAGDPSTSRSTTGIIVNMASGPVIWRSQLQKGVTLSSTEAEYLALTETAREVKWLKNMLTELTPFTKYNPGVVKMFVDNQSAISLATDHTNSRRSKHVSLRNHFCREQAEEGEIKVEYINTHQQLADTLTKPVTSDPLQTLHTAKQ